MSEETINVVAGIIRRNEEYLVAKRPDDTHLGDYWEFPGGKPEAGESDQEALYRELREELAVEASIEDQAFEQTHTYESRTVHLRFYHCTIPETASPEPVECQRVQWVHVDELSSLRFPPADRPLLQHLLNQHHSAGTNS